MAGTEHIERPLSTHCGRPGRDSGQHLHIFDGLDEAMAPREQVLGALLNAALGRRSSQLLVTTRPTIVGRPMAHVDLKPMNFAQTAMLLRRLNVGTDAPPDDLVHLANGNPAVANLLGAYAREHGGYDAARTLLAPFEQAGLVGPDGAPLRRDDPAAARIIANVCDVNDELIDILRRDPDRVFEMGPRRFEEITARLFERLGYDVTMTPAARDGGKDLYIASTDHLGSFLFYVECKRYSPTNPVGVGLVRQLAGVLETDRATAAILLTTSRFTAPAREIEGKLRHRLSLKDYGDFKALLAAAGRRG